MLEIEQRCARVIATSYRDDVFWRMLLDQFVGAGPFDGACLVCAKALILWADQGTLVRLLDAKTRVTHHYGVRLGRGGVLFDWLGAHRSGAIWIRRFAKAENIKASLAFAEGYDGNSDIPEDVWAERALARYFAMISEAATDSPPASRRRAEGVSHQTRGEE